MKPKYLSTEEFKKRKNIKLFQLLNDEDFWIRFNSISMSKYRISRLRQYRSKLIYPKRKFLSTFVDEDYRLITGDTRETREIILDLLSVNTEELGEKVI